METDFINELLLIGHADEVWCRLTLNAFEPWKEDHLPKQKVSVKAEAKVNHNSLTGQLQILVPHDSEQENVFLVE